MEILLEDEAATGRLAAQLAALARPGDVLLLRGDLGQGKTAFARGFLRSRSGDPDLEVPSPTFTLVQTYDLDPPVWHFDLYRLKGPEEAFELGLEEAQFDGISLIEWPERLGSWRPADSLELTFSPGPSPDARLVTLAGGRRDLRLQAFLDQAGWGAADRRRLAGDASFRHYDRLRFPDGRQAVLMDAPPPKEDIRPFMAIARHLRAQGYSAPEILAADSEAGLLLLEDLGDATYTRMLAAGGEEEALYALAVDLLIDLHRRNPPPDCPPYDDRRLLDEAALLVDWTWPASPAQRAVYLGLWQDLLPAARAVPECLVLRDYHVDNLMWLPDREGLEACGLLDFQDAVRGPVTYDLVSLLEDARRDIDPGLALRMKARYLSAFPTLDPEKFAGSYAILGAQRNAKIIGIFTRLARRDGKPAYLAHIPRVWRLLEGALRHPALEGVKDWFDTHIPPAQRGVPS